MGDRQRLQGCNQNEKTSALVYTTTITMEWLTLGGTCLFATGLALFQRKLFRMRARARLRRWQLRLHNRSLGARLPSLERAVHYAEVRLQHDLASKLRSLLRPSSN